MMRKYFKAIALIAVLTGLMACSKRNDSVVAQVDGAKITSSDLMQEMRMERTIYDPAVLTTTANFEAFRRQALERLVQESVMLGEASRLGIEAEAAPAEGEPAVDMLKERGIEPKRWREAQRRRAIIRELIQRQVISGIPIDESDVKAYYNKHLREFRVGASFHAKQILVDRKADAERIHARLMKGEDFATLAKEFSVSPDAKRGGDLGYFDAKAYPEIFAEICQKLEPGEISEAIATPYGFQLFELIDRRPARQRPLTEVRGEIMKILREERIDGAYRPWIARLMEGAQVRIDEKILKGVRLDG